MADIRTVEANKTRGVQIFSADAIETATKFIEDHSGDDWKPIVRIARKMIRYEGRRPVISMKDGSKRVLALHDIFENMGVVIDILATDLALASAMSPDDFRINVLLLLSEPGFGKTYFAHSLAEAIGTQAFKVSAAGAQGAFQLCGTSAHYRDPLPGAVIKLLSGESASPILLVDEVDKIGADDRFPMVPVLLDLFEQGRVVVLRGAGLSTASGIPDLRDRHG